MVAGREREAPAAFVRARAALAAVRPRAEVVLGDTPAPTRLAPHAVAVSAEVCVGGAELATGRLVLLHDPAGQEAWAGTFRFVAYLRAEVEEDLGADPLLCEVTWSWLTDALATRDAGVVAASGTVTRTQSVGFGGMAEDPHRAEVELRASWSPPPGTTRWAAVPAPTPLPGPTCWPPRPACRRPSRRWCRCGSAACGRPGCRGAGDGTGRTTDRAGRAGRVG